MTLSDDSPVLSHDMSPTISTRLTGALVD